MIDYHRAYIGTKMELKPETFKGIMFKAELFMSSSYCMLLL